MMKLPRTRGINTNRRAYDNHIHVSFLSFTPRLHQHRDDGCNLQNHDQPIEYSSTTPPRYLAVDRSKNLKSLETSNIKYHSSYHFISIMILYNY